MSSSTTKSPLVWGVDYLSTYDNSTGTMKFTSLDNVVKWVTLREARYGPQSVIRIRRISR